MTDMDEDMTAVVDAELRLLDPEIRADADSVRALLHRDFREIGSSGATWDRDSVTDATADTAEHITAEDLRPVRLGPDAILLTYTARLGPHASWRSSVWVRSDDRWRMLHHQGTPVPTGEGQLPETG